MSTRSNCRLVIICCMAIVLATSAFAQVQPAPQGSVRRPLASPADIFELYDIKANQLEGFADGQPLSSQEEEVVAKILYVFPKLGLENLHRWRQSGDWDAISAAPASNRVQVFHLAGRVKRAEKRPLTPEQAELFEFRDYYRVTVALGAAPFEAIIAARRIPAAWELDAAIDERVQADAIFLKLGEGVAQPISLYFASERIAWLPDRLDAEHHVGASQLSLARQGMDIGLWDDVRTAKETALGAADREPFYQLLALLSKSDARIRPEHDSIDIVALLEKPEAHFGEVLPLEGTVRRIMRIPVSDADIKSRFGLDHYYELDMFLPLRGAGLRLGKNAPDEGNPVYHNNFPATLVASRLPPGLTEGENLNDLLRADAVFFKTWNYRSSYTSRFGQLQPAPLFMTRQPEVVRLEHLANWITTSLVIAALAVALGITAVLLCWFSWSDRRARRKSQGQSSIATPPDFSHLT